MPNYSVVEDFQNSQETCGGLRRPRASHAKPRASSRLCYALCKREPRCSTNKICCGEIGVCTSVDRWNICGERGTRRKGQALRMVATSRRKISSLYCCASVGYSTFCNEAKGRFVFVFGACFGLLQMWHAPSRTAFGCTETSSPVHVCSAAIHERPMGRLHRR